MSHSTYDLLDNTPKRRNGWRRDLAVTSTVALLLALSFVLGRLSAGSDTAAAPRAVTGAPAPSAQATSPAAADVAIARAEAALRAGVRIQPMPVPR